MAYFPPSVGSVVVETVTRDVGLAVEVVVTGSSLHSRQGVLGQADGKATMVVRFVSPVLGL